MGWLNAAWPPNSALQALDPWNSTLTVYLIFKATHILHNILFPRCPICLWHICMPHLPVFYKTPQNLLFMYSFQHLQKKSFLSETAQGSGNIHNSWKYCLRPRGENFFLPWKCAFAMKDSIQTQPPSLLPVPPKKKKSQGGTGSSKAKYTWENRCGKTKPIAFHEELPKITLARQTCDLQRSLLLEWVRMVNPFLPLQWTGNTFSLSTKFSCSGPLTPDYISRLCRCWDKVERV